MATISKRDLLSRGNYNIIGQRLAEGKPFKVKDQNGESFIVESVVQDKVKLDVQKLKAEHLSTMVQGWAENKQIKLAKIVFQGKIVGANKTIKQPVSKLWKDYELAGKKPGGGAAVSKEHTERQERVLVELVNHHARKYGPLNIPGVRQKIVGAKKVEGLAATGQEPYIDVSLIAENGKEVGVSCKDVTAPSLAGGGLVGLKLIDEDLIRRLFKTIETHYSALGFVHGSEHPSNTIPDLYVKIPSAKIQRILEGTKRMGGPVELMYIGPMDVKTSREAKNGNVSYNGNFIPTETYARKYDFYFRVRLRNQGTITIDYQTKNKSGFPVVFKKGNSNVARIVIQNKVPSNNKAVNLI